MNSTICVREHKYLVYFPCAYCMLTLDVPILFLSKYRSPRLLFLKFFGRTDLRISASKAKFDAKSDFEVHLAVAPQKPGQNYEKLSFRIKMFAICFLSALKNEMLGIV